MSDPNPVIVVTNEILRRYHRAGALHRAEYGNQSPRERTHHLLAPTYGGVHCSWLPPRGSNRNGAPAVAHVSSQAVLLCVRDPTSTGSDWVIRRLGSNLEDHAGVQHLPDPVEHCGGQQGGALPAGVQQDHQRQRPRFSMILHFLNMERKEVERSASTQGASTSSPRLRFYSKRRVEKTEQFKGFYVKSLKVRLLDKERDNKEADNKERDNRGEREEWKRTSFEELFSLMNQTCPFFPGEYTKK